MAGAACRRGCALLRTHLLGRNSIVNPCKLSRPMSSNIVNDKGHYPFDFVALLKKLKAKGVPSEHVQKTIEVIKDEFNLSQFKSELKGVQEVIKNYLDMSQFESEVKQVEELVKKSQLESEANEDLILSRLKSEVKRVEELVKKDLDISQFEPEVKTEAKEDLNSSRFKPEADQGALIKNTQELIEKYKDHFKSEMNAEDLRVLLKEEQFQIEMEIEANKLINVIKNNLHSSSEVKNEMKKAYLNKVREIIEEIQDNLTEPEPQGSSLDHLIETMKASLEEIVKIKAEPKNLKMKLRSAEVKRRLLEEIETKSKVETKSEIETESEEIKEAKGASSKEEEIEEIKAEPKNPKEGRKIADEDILLIAILTILFLLLFIFFIQ